MLTVAYGRPPWIALTLAFSFGFYGLVKKQVGVGGTQSLAVETTFLFVPALACIVVLQATGEGTLTTEGAGHVLLLAGGGIATAMPLMLFGAAAVRIPLTTIGLLQYVAPIMQFAIGVGDQARGHARLALGRLRARLDRGRRLHVGLAATRAPAGRGYRPGMTARSAPGAQRVRPGGRRRRLVHGQRPRRGLDDERGVRRRLHLRGRPGRFGQIGYTLQVLQPGQPNGMYHREDDQEDFLVLSGECLAIIEGSERPLKAWDFVHCPPGTEHIFVGAGDGPCVIFMAGAREHRGSAVYMRDEAALRARRGRRDRDAAVQGGLRAATRSGARPAGDDALLALLRARRVALALADDHVLLL